MKKRLSLFVAIVMILSILPVATSATSPGLSNFKKENTYSQGQFMDVFSADWFADEVATAYELGLVKGTSATTFSPLGKIKISEVITLASRLHSIYYDNDMKFVQGNPWYQVYVNYAIDNGIITINQFANYNANATRAEFATVIAAALPNEAFKQINDIVSIPDVSDYASYKNAVYKLYNAGILTGNDSYGTFTPNNDIKRSEVAAIISRIAIPSLRKNISLDTHKTIDGRIQIYGTYIKVNSADGVSVYIQWENLSEKEIKYIYFNVELYNRVHDTLACDITGDRAQWLRQVGPIPTGKGLYNCVSVSSSNGGQRPFQPDVSYETYKNDERNGWEGQYWDCIWYNSEAYYAKVIGVEIEYMDGTVFKENRRAIFDNSNITNLNINDEVYKHVWKYPVSAQLIPKDFPFSSFNTCIDSVIIDDVTGASENEALFTCRLKGRTSGSFVMINVDVVDECGNSLLFPSPYITIIKPGEFISEEFYLNTPISGTYYLIVKSAF